MKFQKTKQKTLYPLVLTSPDVDIDWEQVARNAYKQKAHFKILLDHECEKQGLKLTDEEKETFWVSRQSKASLREMYIDSKFDISLLAGDFDTLYFEGFTPEDINFWDPSKMKDKSAITKDLKTFVEKFLKEKLHSIEFRASLSEDEKISKEEVIQQFIEQMTLDEVNYLNKFIAVVIEGTIAKKKTSAFIAG